jgi:hypothetical protein
MNWEAITRCAAKQMSDDTSERAEAILRDSRELIEASGNHEDAARRLAEQVDLLVREYTHV